MEFLEPTVFINNLRNDIEKSSEIVLKSLSGSIDRLQKAFPRYQSFLMEFLQNADDENSTNFLVHLENDSLTISNDGNTFTENNIKSLCAVGNSDKSLDNYIGYLGVGFKSVFLISDYVKVSSYPYSFSFLKSFWSNDRFPWQVTPIWDDDLIEPLNNFKTNFYIKIKHPSYYDQIHEELTSSHINNRILLTLKNIRTITLIDEVSNTKREFSKSLLNETDDYKIWSITENETEEKWLVIKNSYEVPQEVKDDPITIDWERSGVKVREVSAIFKLDANNNLSYVDNATAHIGVFSFIPLKDVKSGLRFLIQADFITNIGRGEINRDCLWNNWIATCIFNLIKNRCINIFKTNDNWKYNFTSILYSFSTDGHILFTSKIIIPLKTFLENDPVFLSEQNNYIKKDEVIWLDSDFIDLLNNEDIPYLFPGKEILNRKCNTYLPEYQDKIYPTEYHPFAYEKFGNKLFSYKASIKDYNWFIKLLKYLLSKYNKSYFLKNHKQYNVHQNDFWNNLATTDKEFILTDDYSLASPKNCYINTDNIEIPDIIRDKVKIINPFLLNDPNFQEFKKDISHTRHLNSAKVSCFIKVTKTLLNKKILENEVLNLSETDWFNYNEETKIDFINTLIDLFNKIDLDKYKFLTLPSKTGKWLKPNELFFPSEYEPQHQNLEKLLNQKLFNLPIEFLSPKFISIPDSPTKSYLINFFKKLGVDEQIEKNKNLAERISILKALDYEKKENREARELGGSEKPGYDIESKNEKEKRLIEVKGSHSSSLNIFLSPNEYKSLANNTDEYYVYVVLDALKNPVVNVLRGKDLLDIEEVNITIPFNKWITKKIN